MTTYVPISWALWALAIGMTLAFLCGRHYRNARRLLKARASARKEFAHVFKREKELAHLFNRSLKPRALASAEKEASK
jgi:membrane protein DedA with SNARE-associated domain